MVFMGNFLLANLFNFINCCGENIFGIFDEIISQFDAMFNDFGITRFSIVNIVLTMTWKKIIFNPLTLFFSFKTFANSHFVQKSSFLLFIIDKVLFKVAIGHELCANWTDCEAAEPFMTKMEIFFIVQKNFFLCCVILK